MFYKVNEIRPYRIGNTIYFGKIIEVNIQKRLYTIEDLRSKNKYTLKEKDIFIGDD